MHLKYLYLILLLFSIQVSFGQRSLNGKAVKIIDGDTFDLLSDNKITYRIRLADIDCPERGQDFYKASKNALGSLLQNEYLNIIYKNKDRNGRLIGTIYIRQKNINKRMVEQGYAWHFKKYSNDKEIAFAENMARKLKAGIWSLENPIAPWDFRKLRHKK